MKPTNEQLNAGFQIVLAIAEAIRELKEVPAGHLYAHLCDKLTLDEFQQIIALLSRQNLIAQDSSHLIRWIGGAK